MFLLAGDEGESSSRASSEWPRTAMRMLLKSCAIPPARIPRLSSFCVCCICRSSFILSSSIFLTSVISWFTTMAPSTFPSLSRTGAVELSIVLFSLSNPSISSSSLFIVTPSLMVLARAHSSGFISSPDGSLHARNTPYSSIPTFFSAPHIFIPAGFPEISRPSLSVIQSPTGSTSNIFPRRFSLFLIACSAASFSVMSLATA